MRRRPGRTVTSWNDSLRVLSDMTATIAVAVLVHTQCVEGLRVRHRAVRSCAGESTTRASDRSNCKAINHSSFCSAQNIMCMPPPPERDLSAKNPTKTRPQSSKRRYAAAPDIGARQPTHQMCTRPVDVDPHHGYYARICQNSHRWGSAAPGAGPRGALRSELRFVTRPARTARPTQSATRTTRGQASPSAGSVASRNRACPGTPNQYRLER